MRRLPARRAVAGSLNEIGRSRFEAEPKNQKNTLGMQTLKKPRADHSTPVFAKIEP